MSDKMTADVIVKKWEFQPRNIDTLLSYFYMKTCDGTH